MGDTKHKKVALHTKTFPYVGNRERVAGNRFLLGHWTMNMGIAQDHNPAVGSRVVWQQGLEDTEFLVLTNAVTEGNTQTYPEPGVERIVGRGKFVLTPGNYMRIRILAAPSGETQDDTGGGGFPLWQPQGVEGSFVVTCSFTNGDASETREYEIPILGSELESGSLPNSNAGTWKELRKGFVKQVVPSFIKVNAEKSSDYSELTTAELTIKHRGSLRLVHATVSEFPVNHAHFHHSSSKGSVHAYTEYGGEPQSNLTYRPQVEGKDGTFTEHRFGTHQFLDVMNNQAQRLGPQLFSFTSYTERSGSVSLTEQDPITIDGTAWKDITDTSITTWAETNPGWCVPAYLAQQYKINDPALIARGKYAVLPVRAQLYASSTLNTTGTLRFQSSECSWYEMDFSGSSYDWTEDVFYLEGNVAADIINGTNLQIFAKTNSSTAGDEIVIRNLQLEFGDFRRPGQT